MRITVKPPSPAPAALVAGSLLTVRVEAADPAPLISGPPSIAYEGRWAPQEGAFLFPVALSDAPAHRTPASNPFRLPPPARLQDRVDVPAGPGDRVVATLTAGGQTYSAAVTLPADPPQPSALALVLAEGAAPPGPPPGPAPGLTITPDPADPDVLTLDPAPGNDTIVVVK